MATSSPAFRVPRSRAFQTHAALRAEILEALSLLLFDAAQNAYDARAAFEDVFARVMGQRHAIAVHSGTIALFLALRACAIGRGDEVITVSNSDISTVAAIRHCGATPVLCDVLATDYTLDVRLVEALITPRTRALLPVDLHGHPADVKRLRAVADRHGLRIIEDAALAAGAFDDGQPVGAFADVSVFSFAPFKPLGSVGNGAMIVTNDDHIAAQARLLVGYGHTSALNAAPDGHQHYIEEGFNVPLDGLQAALLAIKLPYLAAWTTQRRAIADAYARGLAGTAVICPTFRAESAPTFRSFTIRVPDQRAFYAHLRRAGVEVVLHYTPPTHQQPVYAGLFDPVTLPITERLSGELLSLPVAPELTTDDVEFVVQELRTLLDAV
ncbi:MAG: DegT/DnrJ/EryC1/StrS family aminotransferase [Chloroflexota bacterium]|nr:DegT/DnrJ/EryC1/StrS family aminotransferase [Chloroflexota bacterium]